MAYLKEFNRGPPWRGYREDDTLSVVCDSPDETGRVSRRGVSIHPDRESLCYMSHEDWWEHFQAEAQDIKVGFLPGSPLLICFCFSKPSLRAFKPFQIGKALALKWSGVCPNTDSRAQIFWLRLMWCDVTLCFNLTRPWTAADCDEPKPDLTQILTIAGRCLLFCRNRRQLLRRGKISLSFSNLLFWRFRQAQRSLSIK